MKQRKRKLRMTKFLNRTFTVGPKQGEKISDVQWEIATGLRCPKCTSRFLEGQTSCPDFLCRENALATAEAAPDRDWTPEEETLLDAMQGVAIGYFDGGSGSNPGIGAAAWRLEFSTSPHDYDDGVHKLGETTNNRAEYTALIKLLSHALDNGVLRIVVYGDSKLVVEQVNGNWKVKDADLKPLAEKAKRLAAEFEAFKLSWIPREENTKCDALVKQAIKEQRNG